MKDEGGWFLTFLAVLLLGFSVASFVLAFPGWVTLVAIVGWCLLIALAIWIEWAPKDFIFTFVAEGTIKVVTRGGTPYKFLLRWQGWHFATQEEIDNPQSTQALRCWDIVLTKEEKPAAFWRRLFGGLEFVGIPPWQEIFVYHFKWSHLHEDGTIHTHDEWLDYAYAMWDIYAIEMKSVEDKNGMPLSITLIIPMRIVNPYEALFEVGRWLPMVTGLLQSPLRRFIGQFSYQELLTMMTQKEGDLRSLFWKEVDKAFEEQENVRTVRNTTARLRIYGVEIDKTRSGLNRVDPPDSYREMTTKQYEASQEGEAAKIKGAAIGAATAKKISIPVLTIAKQMSGLSQVPDEDLTGEQWQKIEEKIDAALKIYLTQQGIEALKASDKVVISGGGREIGEDIAGLTVHEMVRQEIKNREKQKKEE